jgi:hypothetical protein
VLASILLSTKGAYFRVCIFLSTKGAYYGANNQALANQMLALLPLLAVLLSTISTSYGA